MRWLFYDTILDRLTRSFCWMTRIILNRVIDSKTWVSQRSKYRTVWHRSLSLSLFPCLGVVIVYADNVVVGVSTPSVISNTLLDAHTLLSCTFYHLFIGGDPVIARKDIVVRDVLATLLLSTCHRLLHHSYTHCLNKHKIYTFCNHSEHILIFTRWWMI